MVAPHPDDEVLGCGGLIARQRSRGIDVLVVAVTDGDAAFGCADPRLAWVRRREQVAACAELGVHPGALLRLGLPDGAVAEHESAVTTAVGELLCDGDLVVAPWTRDHHCDHEAVGRAVARLAVGHGVRRPVQQVGSLVWGPLRSAPPDDGELPLLALRLRPDEQRRRLAALDRHRSQHGDAGRPAVITDDLVRSFRNPTERYVTLAPDTVAR